jgi:Tfp pilus assembly protein PilF
LRRRSIRAAAGIVGFTAALSLGGILQACGGEEPVAKSPHSASSADAGPATTSSTPTAVVDHSGSPANPPAKSGLSGEAATLYDQAYKAFLSGDLQAAKNGFRSASEKAPKAGSAHYSLGCVLERLGDVSGAQGEYRQSFTVDPTFYGGVGALATSLARNGHASEAEGVVSDAQKSAPDNVQLLTFMAEVKSLEGGEANSAQAQKLAQQALSIDQRFTPAMLVIARDYFRERRYEIAKAAITAVLDGSDDKSTPPRDPTNPDALLLRALIARVQGDRKTALENFQKAIAGRPDLYEAEVNIGEMKLESGNAADAQAPLETAVKYGPNNAIAHLDLGECYRLLGRPADAKKEFDTTMSEDSSIAAVHYNLGLLYLYGQNVPGVSNKNDQIAMAIAEIQKYQQMRGTLPRGKTDDSDDLLSTAKRKQSELQQTQMAASAAAAASAAPPPPAASGSSAPAPSGSAGP